VMWPTLATTLVAVASAATAATSGSVGPGAHQDGKYNVLFIVVDSEFYLRFPLLHKNHWSALHAHESP
jgi:hypothetical protein